VYFRENGACYLPLTHSNYAGCSYGMYISHTVYKRYTVRRNVYREKRWIKSNLGPYISQDGCGWTRHSICSQ